MGTAKLVAGDKPDFIWYAPKGMVAPAYYEKDATGDWKKGAPIPKTWAEAAVSASYQTNLNYSAGTDENGNYPFRPQPEVVFKIAKKLLDLSRE